MGKVPLLWLPFFYYPGATFVFNPSFGFDSTKGLFFSATFELWGTYPEIEKDQSLSLSALLVDQKEGQKQKQGWIYTQKEGTSALNTWAQKSGSYFSLLFDAYQWHGTAVGFETHNVFFAKKLRLDGFGTLAFLGKDAEDLSSVYQLKPIRWALEAKAEYSGPYLQLSAQLPLYSDPKVMRDYRNRLTYFSLSSLSRDFSIPIQYANDIVSYQWNLLASATFPTARLKPYITTLSLQKLGMNVEWQALKKAEGSGFHAANITFADAAFTMGGDFIRFTGPAKN
ncbi:MAG: hypothetical protein ACOXZ4_03270 [Sphaerochaetaceae bacterium]